VPLVLTVGLFVIGVIVVVGAAAYLIDESTERHERAANDRDRHS
jgi:hypothetical protein